LVSTTDLLAFVVSQNVKRRQLKAGPLAIAAAEAWIEAEKAGQIAEHGGDRRSTAHKGHLIKNPRDYFAKLFGVGKNYVEHARALLKDDPLAAASIKKAGASLQEKYDELQLRRGGEANQQGRMRKLREQRQSLDHALGRHRVRVVPL
jgi:hypothetical protein